MSSVETPIFAASCCRVMPTARRRERSSFGESKAMIFRANLRLNFADDANMVVQLTRCGYGFAMRDARPRSARSSRRFDQQPKRRAMRECEEIRVFEGVAERTGKRAAQFSGARKTIRRAPASETWCANTACMA